MKKIILLVLVLIFIPTLAISAETPKKIEITLQDQSIPMDHSMLKDFKDEILIEFPDAKKIEIYEYMTPATKIINSQSYKTDSANNILNNIIGKKATQIFVSTQTIISTYNSSYKDTLAFNLVSGSSKILSSDISGSAKATYGGSPFSAEQLGSTINLTTGYKKDVEFFGPLEGEGNYTNREFRIRFYQEEGNYVQAKKTLFNLGKAEEEVVYGEYTKPTKIILYSIDFS